MHRELAPSPPLVSSRVFVSLCFISAWASQDPVSQFITIIPPREYTKFNSSASQLPTGGERGGINRQKGREREEEGETNEEVGRAKVKREHPRERERERIKPSWVSISRVEASREDSSGLEEGYRLHSRLCILLASQKQRVQCSEALLRSAGCCGRTAAAAASQPASQPTAGTGRTQAGEM